MRWKIFFWSAFVLVVMMGLAFFGRRVIIAYHENEMRQGFEDVEVVDGEFQHDEERVDYHRKALIGWGTLAERTIEFKHISTEPREIRVLQRMISDRFSDNRHVRVQETSHVQPCVITVCDYSV